MIEYTDWFPPDVHPVREGLYIIKHGPLGECWHMGWFHKGCWYAAEAGMNGHFTEMDVLGGIFENSRYYWRGLTSKL